MKKKKKEVVITGIMIARIAGILGIVTILVSAIISGVREGAPLALFTENPFILAVIPACLISFIIKEKKDDSDQNQS